MIVNLVGLRCARPTLPFLVAEWLVWLREWRGWMTAFYDRLNPTLGGTTMRRRDMLKAGLGGAASLLAIQRGAFAGADEESPRVALIGCGWYGKTDLNHLIQVAPVEVVGL